MQWRQIQFSDVMTMNRRPYLLGPTEDAELVGMRLYGLGPFHRESKPSYRIRKKTHFVIKEGDVIYNKLFAWKGTFGIVPRELDGMFVSDKFPTYKLDDQVVFPPYLEWYFRLPKLWNYAKRNSKGSAALSKLTLNPPQFLGLPLLLPSISHQRHISKQLDAAIGRINEAWSIRKQPSRLLFGRSMSVAQEGRLILHSALVKLQDQLGAGLGKFESILIDTLRSGPSFPVSDEGSGIAVVMPSCVGSFQFQESRLLYGTLINSVPDKDLLKSGDILFSRGNKKEHVGTCAVFPGLPYPTSYANLFMRVRVNPEIYVPDFVQFWLMTPVVRRHVRAYTKGTSPTVQKINSSGVKSIPFPVGVSIDVQREWVERLTRVRQRCDAIEERVEDLAAELRLLPQAVVNDIFEEQWNLLVN